MILLMLIRFLPPLMPIIFAAIHDMMLPPR